MARPTTSDLLDAWESGLGLPPSDRCLPLLATSDPRSSPEEMAHLPVGDRDARLLDLREWAFGPSMTGAARCPSCGAELELPVDLDAIRVGAAVGRNGSAPDGGAALEVEGYEVRFRLPDSVDMREAAHANTVDGAREILLRRCVVSATRDGAPLDPAALPAAVLARVEDAMAERDAHADVQFALTCPDCTHAWDAELDVGIFLWREIDQWARRLLVDVATLAAAFGWTEAEILRLGPARRQAYLELAGG